MSAKADFKIHFVVIHLYAPNELHVWYAPNELHV